MVILGVGAVQGGVVFHLIFTIDIHVCLLLLGWVGCRRHAFHAHRAVQAVDVLRPMLAKKGWCRHCP